MTTVTGMTAARMLEIEAASIVDGDVVGDNLILTKHDGSTVNAGSVRGPQGVAGPPSSDLAVITARQILDVGVPLQIRAGRELTVADFTNMNLAAPIGLWNLSNLTDASGNGRALLNKGSVPFDVGINGVASTCAKFSGSSALALYISDTGAADPFRIKFGSFGAWFRTPKRATVMDVISKRSTAAGQFVYDIQINSNNVVTGWISTTGSDTPIATGFTDVCDDRWHFVVCTYDGTAIRLYVDGVLEAVGTTASGPIFGGNSPLNIGGGAADASTANASPLSGRVDEAFVTSDVLSEDEIRNLYCAKITHTLAAVPGRVTLKVKRRRKGAAFVSADFSTAPLRLHNFSAASLADEGSGNVALTNNGTAVAVPGADGSSGNAFGFAGAQSLSSTDAGLPATTTTRSYGCWVKTNASALVGVYGWGTLTTADARIFITAAGLIASASAGDQITGPFIADGQWHFVVVIEDNAASDGLKRKLYVDGRLVGASLTMNSITLAGANRYRIGGNPDGTSLFTGQIDGVFVTNYAMTLYDILWLYDKGSQQLAPSPKNAGDHIEAVSTTDLLAVFDTLDPQHLIDLGVAA